MIYLYIFTFLFVTTAIAPFLNLSDPQFKKYDISNIPLSYKEYFVESYTGVPESTYYALGPCWTAQYMDTAGIRQICLNFGLQYLPAVLSDPRLIAGDKYILSETLAKYAPINIMRITHNLKHIIVPKDAVDKKESQIAKGQQLMLENNNLLAAKENQNFIHFYFRDKDNYDFLLYSPAEIIYGKNINEIIDLNVNIERRPAILTTPPEMELNGLRAVNVDYKISPLNPTKYYIHVKNIPDKQPFALQFNQDYNQAWKIKWVDKTYFDKIACVSKYKSFSITQNAYCQYANSLLDLSDIQLLAKPGADNKFHFKGNFVNNAWIVKPQNQSDLYAVVINEKQIYYTISIILFCVTLVTFFILAITQEIHNIIKRAKI